MDNSGGIIEYILRWANVEYLASWDKFEWMHPESFLSRFYLHNLHTIMANLLLDGVGVCSTYAGFILQIVSLKTEWNLMMVIMLPEVCNSTTIFRILEACYAIQSLKSKGASMRSWLIWNWLITELRNNKFSAEPQWQFPVLHVKYCGKVNQGPYVVLKTSPRVIVPWKS